MEQGRGSSAPFREQVRSEISQELREASSVDAKKNILVLILKKLKSLGQKAARLIMGKDGDDDEEKRKRKEDIEEVEKPIIQMIEAFEKSAGNQEIADAVLKALTEESISQSQRIFLQTIAKKAGRSNELFALGEVLSKSVGAADYLRLSATPGQPTPLETDLAKLKNNPEALQHVISTLIELADARQLLDTAGDVLTSEQVVQRMQIQDSTVRAEVERQRERKQNGMAQVEFERLFLDSSGDPDKKEAYAFHEAIKSSNPDEIAKYFQDKVDQKKLEKNIPESEAAKLVTADIHKIVLYTVNTIYSTTLSKAPKEPFENLVRADQVGYVNADNVFTETVTGALNRLMDSAQSKGDMSAGPDFYVHDRRSQPSYNPERRKIETTTVPVAELTKTSLTKFIDSLREMAENEKGALAYQFNLRYLFENPQGADKGGVFGSIKEYAKKNLRTETIDNLYIFPGNDLIQAAVMSLEPMYKKLFAQYDWRKDPAMQTQFLEKLRPAEKKAEDQLLAYFKGEKKPWEIRRALNHARLLSFGKEFSFQALASYADPYLKDSGDQTYIGEGALANNAVFDIMAAAKQWGSGDPIIVNLPYMPQNIMLNDKDFNPLEIAKDGQERWGKSFEHGELAYYDSDIFRNSKPIISITNMTKMGGVDTYGGWRVKSTYMHWLHDMVDQKTGNLKMNTPDALVNGWKSLENIGTNVLKNYADSFLYEDGIKPGYYSDNEAQFEQFFKFLHTRYFKDGVGKSLVGEITDSTAFWNKVKREMTANGATGGANQKEVVKKYVYDALTVALFERMPTEFVYMERRRASQNGVTLQSELQEEFIGTQQNKGKWTQDVNSEDGFSDALTRKWDVANDDLIYVQQRARMSSIEKMKEIQARERNSSKLGALYGDLSKDRSEEVKYAVTPEFIEEQLRRKYERDPPDPDVEGKVSRAKDLYLSIFRRMQEKPEEGELEKKWYTEDRSKYQKVRNEHITTRSRWFANTWKNNDFGMQFTTSEAGQFLNRSATGDELVSRTADACFVISESTKNFMAGGGMLEGISSAVRKGKEGWEDLYKGVSEVYTAAKSEDVERAKGLVRQLVNWQILALRRDRRYVGFSGELDARLGRKRTSLASTKVDAGGVAYDFRDHDIAEYVGLYTAKNILPGYSDEKKKLYKEIPPSWIEKTVARVTGRDAKGRIVRDYENESAGEAILRMHKAARPEVLKKNLPTFMGLLALAIIWAYLQKAVQEAEGK